MWCPEKITIENLFAHKYSEYRFKNNQCTVIFGKNNTDRGMENNGAGKTTLLEGIAIALTNESLREVKKEAFINREEEECCVDFSLFNPTLKKKLRIVRRFFRGNKAVKVELYEDDQLNRQITGVAEANKRVFELIGISREDLLRYFIISQDNRYTFFTASDGDKKEIMNRITSADAVNPVLEELSLRLKEKEADYKIISDEVNELSTRKEIYEEQAEELVKQDNTDELIEELNEKITEAKENIEFVQKDCLKFEKSVKLREEQMATIKVEDATDLKKERKELKAEIDELDEELSETKTIQKRLQAVIDGVIVCPNCGEEIVEENDFEVSADEARELIKEAKQTIPKLEKKLEARRTKFKKLKTKIEEAERGQELMEELEDEKSQYERKLKRKREEAQDLDKDIMKWEAEKKSLKNQKKDNKQLKSLQEKINQTEAEIQPKLTQIAKLTEELEMIRFWQFHMGRSGFTTYLANKSIKVIEGITNSFLRKFDVDLSVSISGFTVLKSGEVREKIDVFIQSDGTTAETFKAKSGGEKGRVNLAGVLGIQHLINLSTNGKGLNLLCFDECFHGIDSKGQENIIKIFEKLGVTILMITQNVSETFNSENKLFVVKERNIARYVENLQS